MLVKGGPGYLSLKRDYIWNMKDHLHVMSVTRFISTLFMLEGFNSLWPSDAIYKQHISMSTLVQVMACCLMAPSHCLNQC